MCRKIPYVLEEKLDNIDEKFDRLEEVVPSMAEKQAQDKVAGNKLIIGAFSQ